MMHGRCSDLMHCPVMWTWCMHVTPQCSKLSKHQADGLRATLGYPPFHLPLFATGT